MMKNTRDLEELVREPRIKTNWREVLLTTSLWTILPERTDSWVSLYRDIVSSCTCRTLVVIAFVLTFSRRDLGEVGSPVTIA